MNASGFTEWQYDHVQQRYYRYRLNSAENRWEHEWSPNPQDQTTSNAPGPAAGGSAYPNSNPSGYPPTQYGGNQGQPYLVDNLASALETHTLEDDDQHAPKPVPTQPDTSSDSIYKVVLPKDQRRFFRKGKVIKLEWVQPRGQPFGAGRTPSNTPSSDSAISEIRRFVIIKPNKLFSLCLPIQTYGGRATLHPAAKPANHVMVYSGDKAPDPLPGEKLTKLPIKVEPRHGGEVLVKASRLDLAKIYTIEHNVPVAAIGEVDKKDLPRLELYFSEIHRDLLKAEPDSDRDDEEEDEDEEDDDEERRPGPSRGDKPRGSKPSSSGLTTDRRRRTDESIRSIPERRRN